MSKMKPSTFAVVLLLSAGVPAGIWNNYDVALTMAIIAHAVGFLVKGGDEA